MKVASCPKCGNPGSLNIRHRFTKKGKVSYAYVGHYVSEDGKRRMVWHYAGSSKSSKKFIRKIKNISECKRCENPIPLDEGAYCKSCYEHVKERYKYVLSQWSLSTGVSKEELEERVNQEFIPHHDEIKDVLEELSSESVV